jgi:NADPH:quinone reductase-like Zn-dependent oxidoreductase
MFVVCRDHQKRAVGLLVGNSPTFRTADMERQSQILARVAELIDSGELRATRNRTLAGLSAATVSQAHEIMAAGHQIGKLVIAY